MSTQQNLTFASQLKRSVLPRTLLLVSVLCLLLLLTFFISGYNQLQRQHNEYIENITFRLDTAIEQLDVLTSNLATNDLVVNGLVDIEMRQQYLPLFLQSLQVAKSEDVRVAMFNFMGDIIEEDNWNLDLTTEKTEQWQNQIFEQNTTFIDIWKNGVLIIAPVRIADFPEGALGIYVPNLQNLVEPPTYEASQVVFSDSGEIIYSTKADQTNIEFVEKASDSILNYSIQKPWREFEVISSESYFQAYDTLIWLFPMLVFTLVAIAISVIWSINLAASKATNTLNQLNQSLQNSVRRERTRSIESFQDESVELMTIRTSFMELLNEVLSLSLTNTTITNVLDSLTECLFVIDEEQNLILKNYPCSELLNELFASESLLTDIVHEMKNTEQMSLEKYYTAPNGTEIIINWRVSPFYSESQKQNGLVFVGENVSEKRQLRSDLELRNAAMEESEVSIVISEIRENSAPLIYVNKAFCELTGYTKEESVGRDCNFLQGEETSRESIKAIKYALNNSEAVSVTITNYRKDGSKFANDLSLTPVKNAAGVATHYVGIQQDVTIREESARLMVEAKQNAEKFAESQSTFFASISHELRTPINGIHGMLQALVSSELDTQQKKYADVALKSTDALLQIVNDVLDFSKLESQQLKIYAKTFNLKQLIEGIHSSFEFQCESKDLFCKVEMSLNGHEYVIGDSLRIQQILTNLLNNALKFTSAGGISLLVSANSAEQSDHVILSCSVKDTGIGIDKDNLDKIFQVFSQESESTFHTYGGTGLGLSICKELCNLMDGNLTVKSKKGIGSTFTFEIVLDKAKQSDIEELKNTSDAEVVFDGDPIILVAEDNEINQMVTKQQLSDVRTVFVSNGLQALKILSNSKVNIDLILMDCQMPEMNGFIATELIRDSQAGEQYKDIPIIALTANTAQRDKDKCRDAGMDDFIPKPIDRNTLRNKIKQWLDKAASTRT